MAKKVHKSTDNKGKSLKNSKTKQPLLKLKLKLKSKNAKAQTEKLNQDMAKIVDIHSELVLSAHTKKGINALDSKTLQEDLQRDEMVQKESKKAEIDLANQLGLITGMSL